MGTYRVEELAALAEVSVDTVRFYQAKGLLAPPTRQGRIAVYDEAHLERIEHIRLLQGRGFSLAVIRRLVVGELDAADEALVAAVAASSDGYDTPDSDVDGYDDPPGDEAFTIEELAERSGIPIGLLHAVVKEGLLVPRQVAGDRLYTRADVEAARAGLRLLEAGLPLPEVLELARHHHAAMRDVAERCVRLFDEHVRQPLRDAGIADDEAAAKLVAAFHALLPATTALVEHHFRRTLLAVAQEHIERVGVAAELAAVEREAQLLP
jgi:DNA-binding transcriptional MerR regulator